MIKYLNNEEKERGLEVIIEAREKQLRYKKFLELLEEFGGDCPWYDNCSEKAFENYSGREI